VIDKYIIKRRPDYLEVFSEGDLGNQESVAKIVRDDTLAEIAQEFYEVIASIGGIVVEMEDDI
jgi:hypothetical protein